MWHTYTHTERNDHSIPLGYKSPGKTCSIATALLFSCSSSPFNVCSFRSLSLLLFHIHSTFLLTISFLISFAVPSVFPSSLWMPFSKWQIYSESGTQWKAYGDRCVQCGSRCSHRAWWRDYLIFGAAAAAVLPYVWCTLGLWNTTNIPPVSRLL